MKRIRTDDNGDNEEREVEKVFTYSFGLVSTAISYS